MHKYTVFFYNIVIAYFKNYHNVVKNYCPEALHEKKNWSHEWDHWFRASDAQCMLYMHHILTTRSGRFTRNFYYIHSENKIIVSLALNKFLAQKTQFLAWYKDDHDRYRDSRRDLKTGRKKERRHILLIFLEKYFGILSESLFHRFHWRVLALWGPMSEPLEATYTYHSNMASKVLKRTPNCPKRRESRRRSMTE